jgi:hypothetical protein
MSRVGKVGRFRVSGGEEGMKRKAKGIGTKMERGWKGTAREWKGYIERGRKGDGKE